MIIERFAQRDVALHSTKKVERICRANLDFSLSLSVLSSMQFARRRERAAGDKKSLVALHFNSLLGQHYQTVRCSITAQQRIN